MTRINNINYFDGEKFIKNAAVEISGQKITHIYSDNNIPEDDNSVSVIDGNGMKLIPGYIDIHLHGCGGYDIMDNTEEAVKNICLTLGRHGTTSFLPSTVTQSKVNTQKTVQLIRALKGKCDGADILGVHLEGPFINPDRKGAQNPLYIQNPSEAAFKDFIDNDLTDIKRVTLAPEIGEGIALTNWLLSKGVTVSAGHTCADFDTIEKCADSGLNLATHLFNGMNPLHHRDPGTVGASLLDDRISVEFIADLIHLNKNILRLIVKNKGRDKCILITDSLSAACLGDGTFALGGQTVTVHGKEARIEGGSLAGSIITLGEAVKNMIFEVGIDECDAIRMATINPAKIINVDSFKGKIKEGYDADLNLIDDDYNVKMTFIKGQKVM